MTITWLGHACFVLESGGYRILIDPYKNVPGMHDIAALTNEVYCSHEHPDHSYTGGVMLLEGQNSPFTVREVEVYHDNKGGAERGKNMVRCFEAEGLTVVHLGDLGHQLSPQQVAAIGRCDVLLLPVGGHYTVDAMGAKGVVYSLQPTVVVPMHYRKGSIGYEETGPVEDFLDLFPPSVITKYPVSYLQVTKDTPAQIAVLQIP